MKPKGIPTIQSEMRVEARGLFEAEAVARARAQAEDCLYFIANTLVS